MKKIISLLLIGALCTALTACAAKEPKEQNPAQTSVASSEPVSEAATAASDTSAGVYRAVLDAYRTGVRTGFEPKADYPEGGYVSSVVSGYAVTTLSYALIDLCQDGQPELFIVDNANGLGDAASQLRVYDAWGCEEGQPVRLFSADLGWRGNFTIYRDGKVYYDSESNASGHVLFTVEKGGAAVSGKGAEWFDDSEYYAFAYESFTKVSKETRITKEEYDAFYRELEQCEIMKNIPWAPLS